MLAGDEVALAKLITIVESGSAEVPEILQLILPHTGRAFRLGVTGSPGAGKSTLIEKLTAVYRQPGTSLGIVGIDPTSPFTGGALLGDRFRMGSHSTDSRVFIRSMATRGFAGGLASALRGVLKLLDACGKELLIVETAGAGQSEIDIMQVADAVIVVLTPESGDILQAMKAGMMEIGDIYVVNKADRPGAEQIASAIKSVFSLQPGPRGTPVILTSEAANNQGIAELHNQIETARRMLIESGQLIIRRNRHRKHEFIETLEQSVLKQLSELLQGNAAAARYLAEIEKGKIDPQVAAHGFINGITLSHRPVSE